MNLAEYFTGSKENRKIWLNMIPYAKQIFSRNSKDLWSDPTSFISVYSQGQGLLKSDVLSVPVINVYDDLIKREVDYTGQWVGKRPTFILRKILGLDEPKQFLIDILTGLQNLYTGAAPLALMLPSPQSWLKWVLENFIQREEVQIEEDDIEIVSMYLAEYLQHLSELKLSIIVITEVDPTFVPTVEALPLYQPILNVIKHYQWMIGIECSVSTTNIDQIEDEVDFILIKNSSFEDIIPYWEKEVHIGGGLNDNFWTEDLNDKVPEISSLMYGEIPKEANPEEVLTQLKLLRS